MAMDTGVWRWGGLLAGLACCISLCLAQSLTWLGRMTYRSSIATDVSADGSIVVGFAYNQNFDYRAFRWQNGVMEPIASRTGGWSEAHGISADGNVVVGGATGPQAELMTAFRWTAREGMQFLGALGGAMGRANAASADGSVIVGHAEEASGNYSAFRWTAREGMRNLGGFGGSYGVAHGVSADGSVIVGYAKDELDYWRAFRWTQETGMQDLGDFGGLNSRAFRVSADGTVIVGTAEYRGNITHAFRWTEQGGMQDIDTLNSPMSLAYDVSDDGNIVVGHYAPTVDDFFRAFRWTPARGMEDLNIVYADLLADGSVLFQAFATSADGRFIVGSGQNAATGRREAFLLDTRVPCRPHNGDVDESGCVDDADLLAVLFAFGQTGQSLGRVDTNCDAIVDDADLLQVLFNFGQGC